MSKLLALADFIELPDVAAKHAMPVTGCVRCGPEGDVHARHMCDLSHPAWPGVAFDHYWYCDLADERLFDVINLAAQGVRKAGGGSEDTLLARYRAALLAVLDAAHTQTLLLTSAYFRFLVRAGLAREGMELVDVTDQAQGPRFFYDLPARSWLPAVEGPELRYYGNSNGYWVQYMHVKTSGESKLTQATCARLRAAASAAVVAGALVARAAVTPGPRALRAAPGRPLQVQRVPKRAYACVCFVHGAWATLDGGSTYRYGRQPPFAK